MNRAPRLSIALTAPQMTFLNVEAGTLGMPVAELIRRIIDAYRLNQSAGRTQDQRISK